jgi:hypothetical protein
VVGSFEQRYLRGEILLSGPFVPWAHFFPLERHLEDEGSAQSDFLCLDGR